MMAACINMSRLTRKKMADNNNVSKARKNVNLMTDKGKLLT